MSVFLSFFLQESKEIGNSHGGRGKREEGSYFWVALVRRVTSNDMFVMSSVSCSNEYIWLHLFSLLSQL